jgi:Tol biopolymer transport system component
MARTCHACGRANDDDASFCQNCGAALAAPSATAPLAPPTPADAAVPQPPVTPAAKAPAAPAAYAAAQAPSPPAPPAPPPPGTAAGGPRRGGHSRVWIVAIVIAVIVAAVAVASAVYFMGNGGETGGMSPAPSAEPTMAVSPAPELESYLAGAAGPKADRLAAISAKGTVTPISRFSGQQIWQIAYSPDGAWLACVAGTFKRSELWLFEVASGDARQATASTPNVVAVDSIAWLSPTELLMAGYTETPKATGQTADLLVYDLGSEDFSPLTGAAGVSLRGVAVSASRDGDKVAFVTYTDAKTDQYGMASATERLQLLDRASGEVTQLGENEAFFEVNARAFDEPLLSPGGDALIYRRAGSDVGTSYTVIGADGATLMPAKETQFPAGYAWDPEGTRVVFTGHSLKPADDETGIGPAVFWVFDTQTGATEVLARYSDTMVQELSWSPDGQTIAWADYDQDKYRTGTIYLMPATGGDARTFVREALSPVWAPGAGSSLETTSSP